MLNVAMIKDMSIYEVVTIISGTGAASYTKVVVARCNDNG
jgi:hypothetical protein